jgi:hypothetical protein
MIFCEHIKRRVTANVLFKVVDDFMKEKCVYLPDCVGVYLLHGCRSRNGGK